MQERIVSRRTASCLSRFQECTLGEGTKSFVSRIFFEVEGFRRTGRKIGIFCFCQRTKFNCCRWTTAVTKTHHRNTQYKKLNKLANAET